MRLFFYKTDRQTTGRIYNSCYFLTIRDRAIENEKCFFIIKAVDDKGWKKEESINERKKNTMSVYYICNYAHIGMCKWYIKDRGGKIRAEDNRRKWSCSN